MAQSKETSWIRGPFALGIVAAGVVLLGKFAWESNPINVRRSGTVGYLSLWIRGRVAAHRQAVKLSDCNREKVQKVPRKRS